MDEHGTAVAPLSGHEKADNPPPATPPRPGNFPRIVIGMIAILLVGGGVYYWSQHGRAGAKGGHESEGAEGQESQAGAMRVEVIHPTKGGLERTTTQAGSVHAFEHADLFSKVSGYLKVQNVDIGDTVKLGQLLAEIDDPEILKAVDQAKAALEQAKARTQLVAAQIQSAEADRDAANAMVHEAEAEVGTTVATREYRQKQLARVKGLVERGATEAKLLDEEQDRYSSAVAAENVSRAAVLAPAPPWPRSRPRSRSRGPTSSRPRPGCKWRRPTSRRRKSGPRTRRSDPPTTA